MANKPCACKKAAACEECPEWIFTFADLVMLMMGFFVILFVLKPPAGKQGDGAGKTNSEQWINVVGEIREAFGYVPNPNSKDPVDQAIMRKLQKSRQQGPANAGQTQAPNAPKGREDEVTAIRAAIFATQGGKLCFNKGDATLTQTATDALTLLAVQVKGHHNLVMIKGHASLDEVAQGVDDGGGMELSLKRAQAASTFLRQHGVEANLLRVQGCSTFEPVVQHDYTPDGLLLNRRVEVEATAQLVEEFEDNRLPTTQPDAIPSARELP